MGSSNYITNLAGDVSQHMEYFAFGETFVEEHKNSINSPYKFNGKELDEESGLYYYGARYYDPRISIWASVDPLAEKFAGRNSYEYCFSNPLHFTDRDGRAPTDDIRINTKTNETVIYRNNDKFDTVYKDNKYIGRTEKGYGEKMFKEKGVILREGPQGVGMGAVDGAIMFLAAELIGAYVGIVKGASFLKSAMSTTASKVATNAAIDMGVNATTQYVANGGKIGEVNWIESGFSAIPGVPIFGKGAAGKIANELIPVVAGETFSFTAKNGFETPNSPEKWGAQVGGGIASFAFGKVTDNHLAGEKGGPFVGGFFKAVVETGSNAAPNLVKE